MAMGIIPYKVSRGRRRSMGTVAFTLAPALTRSTTTAIRHARGMPTTEPRIFATADTDRTAISTATIRKEPTPESADTMSASGLRTDSVEATSSAGMKPIPLAKHWTMSCRCFAIGFYV